MEIVYITITGLSIIASILAWVAKIRWSSEFREAKKAQIESIQEQIKVLKERNETLKELTSEKIMGHYLSTKEGLESLNNKILEEKNELQIKVDEMETEIERLREENKNSIKLPDFSQLQNMSFQIENSLKSFTENYAIQYNELSNSLEKMKNFDFVIEDKDNFYIIETKKKRKK
ncbi:hypothetical protein [Gramella sp. AN32]|uniref:Uncharacterized protein n=1 Tax=Christiangramia antarctica TaxID=2058158 RepID=A0ABW5X5E9_9FLAO|nr:hypothetical protein [Gramella sp. AN32]MCM4156902.1 hypothetical protein [Gramella sp. AN32]